MHSLWIFKQHDGKYLVSQHQPLSLGDGKFERIPGQIFVDVGVFACILIAGRALNIGECVEVVISEVPKEVLS